MASATASSETVATRGPPLFDRNAAIQWFVAALTLFLVALPLLPIFYQAFLDKPLYYPDTVADAGQFCRVVQRSRVPSRHHQHAVFRGSDDGHLAVRRHWLRDPDWADRPAGPAHFRRHPAVAAVCLASCAGVRLVHHVRPVRLHHAGWCSRCWMWNLGTSTA